jgi:hypothetical protein
MSLLLLNAGANFKWLSWLVILATIISGNGRDWNWCLTAVFIFGYVESLGLSYCSSKLRCYEWDTGGLEVGDPGWVERNSWWRPGLVRSLETFPHTFPSTKLLTQTRILYNYHWAHSAIEFLFPLTLRKHDTIWNKMGCVSLGDEVGG